MLWPTFTCGFASVRIVSSHGSETTTPSPGFCLLLRHVQTGMHCFLLPRILTRPLSCIVLRLDILLCAFILMDFLADMLTADVPIGTTHPKHMQGSCCIIWRDTGVGKAMPLHVGTWR